MRLARSAACFSPEASHRSDSPSTRCAIGGQLGPYHPSTARSQWWIATLLPEQGALFLLRRAGLIEPFAVLSQASAQQQALAMRLSQKLGGLPLALDQAGAYLEETRTDLARYWQVYQRHRSD